MHAIRRSFYVMTVTVLALFMMCQAHAVEVKNLYQASVQVEDRSSSKRVRAIQDGFSRILVKVSGLSTLASEPHVQEELQRAESYVIQYGYESRKIAAVDDLDKQVDGIFLKVKFDPLAVNQFLRRNGNPIWASNRPNMVIWGAYDEGQGRQLLGGAVQEPLQALFKSQAEQRGLPILFPSYDQQDTSQVRAGDIWGMFVDPIVSASSRYQANIVLVAKVSQLRSQARINAMLVMDEQQHWLTQEGSSMEEVVQQLMDQAVDRVGQHYGVLVSNELGQQVVLEVDSVASLSSYAELSQYLESVLAVKSAQLQFMQGDKAQFLLTLESTLDALKQSFKLDKKLFPVSLEPMETLDEGVEQPALSVEEPVEEASLEIVPPEPLDAPPSIRYRWQEPVASR